MVRTTLTLLFAVVMMGGCGKTDQPWSSDPATPKAQSVDRAVSVERLYTMFWRASKTDPEGGVAVRITAPPDSSVDVGAPKFRPPNLNCSR
ncbi:MAG: hypothetical protein ACI9OJ_000867 [Myxococcota bacterium]|jgi:hypothetical protein